MFQYEQSRAEQSRTSESLLYVELIQKLNIMSRNYDNWERLVEAVLKREQIRQLCHQDSISTFYSESSSSSSHLELSYPVSLVSFGDICIFIRTLGKKYDNRTTNLVEVGHDVAMWDQLYVAEGTQAVVKSLHASKITVDEFERHMTALGSCKHENVGTPWAYHFSQATKHIIYHYYGQGSVSDMLGGGRGTRPNWESRLRIAVGAARGIAHIHKQCGGEMAHGNIKSSNIFLNSQGYGLVSDFGILQSRLSKDSDVYNFGVFLLELFTRASPIQEAHIDDHLSSFEPYKWHLSCFGPRVLLVDESDMREERMTLYVDDELMYSLEKEEFRRTLEIAKRCLSLSPWTMAKVVLELEEMEEMEQMLPPPQLSNEDSQHSNKSGDKKRGWNRFLPFAR